MCVGNFCTATPPNKFERYKNMRMKLYGSQQLGLPYSSLSEAPLVMAQSHHWLQVSTIEG